MQRTAILFFIAVMSPYAFAAGGQITFHGAIVEPICDTGIAKFSVTATCVRDGTAAATPVNNDIHATELPYGLGKAHLTAKKSVSILYLEYN